MIFNLLFCNDMINLKDILLPIFILRKTQLYFLFDTKIISIDWCEMWKGEMFDIMTKSFLSIQFWIFYCSIKEHYKRFRLDAISISRVFTTNIKNTYTIHIRKINGNSHNQINMDTQCHKKSKANHKKHKWDKCNERC